MWLSLLLQACEAPAAKETAPETDSAVAPDSADTSTELQEDQPGTVEITTPQEGAVLEATQTLIAQGHDDDGVHGVDWSIDGVQWIQDYDLPSRQPLDTCGLDPGPHVASVTLTDYDENTTTDEVNFIVDQEFSVTLVALTSALADSELVLVQAADDRAITEVVWSFDGVEAARGSASFAGDGCAMECPLECLAFTTTLDTTSLGEGDHTLTVEVANEIGEVKTASQIVTMNRDADGDGVDAISRGGTDCDDDDGRAFPGARESCDGEDQDCDGEADEGYDRDGDGYFDHVRCDDGDDCDDDDAAVNPGATEVCDDLDNDCDGNTDVSTPPGSAADVFGTASTSAVADSQMWANAYTPLRDATLTSFDVYVNPVATLIFSVYEVDESGSSYTLLAGSTVTTGGSTTWYGSGELGVSLTAGRQYLLGVAEESAVRFYYEPFPVLGASAELQADGFVRDTTSTQPSTVTATPSDTVLLNQRVYLAWIEAENEDADADGQNAWCGDCDDEDASIGDGFSELCDGVDNDCDGAVPADEADDDADGDRVCAGDCDDADSARYPSSVELCDGLDNDCDASTTEDDADGDGVVACWDGETMDCADEDAAVLVVARYVDADGDGFGDDATADSTCPYTPGTVLDGGDCDDADADLSPAATEVCDSVDNDCDGDADEGFDADGDGAGACEDCDDADAAVNPAAAETCGDEVDDDCDGYAPACRVEGDIAASEAEIILFGAANYDRAGSQVGAADVDGDGQADVFVSAPGSSYSAADAGSVYLLRGPLTTDLTLDTSTALRLDGVSASDNLGSAVASGDVDGDGWAELVTGAASDDEGGTSAGAAYVIPYDGATSGSVASVAYKLVGETAGDLFGTAVAFGDFDGDSQGDVLVSGTYADGGGSSSGGVWLFAGPIASGADASAYDAKFIGEDTSDYAGTALGSGDLTGDGLDDVLVGASGDDEGGSGAGAIYILSEPWGAADLSLADSKISGAASSDALGSSTLLVVDLDGDGWGDLVAAARGADGDATDSAAVYGWNGPVLGDTSASVADMTLLGQGSNDYAGATLASAGDLDGDGHVDLLVGAYNNDTAGAASGCVYLLYGPPSAAMSLADSGTLFLGESIGDLLGSSAAGNADLNGDGAADLLLGAASSDLVAPNAGAVYLFGGE